MTNNDEPLLKGVVRTTDRRKRLNNCCSSIGQILQREGTPARLVRSSRLLAIPAFHRTAAVPQLSKCASSDAAPINRLATVSS